MALVDMTSFCLPKKKQRKYRIKQKSSHGTSSHAVSICINKYEKPALCSTILLQRFLLNIDTTHLCTNARIRSFRLTSSTFFMVEGGVKHSHWITIAFWRLCNRCCSATPDSLSYWLTLISRDLDKTLFEQFVRSRIALQNDPICILPTTKNKEGPRNRNTSQQFLQNFLLNCLREKIVNTLWQRGRYYTWHAHCQKATQNNYRGFI